MFSCFIHFAKCYDSIAHNLLLLKLAEKSISGNLYFLLRNMYMNCSYAIKVPVPIEPQCNEKNRSKKKMSTNHWFRTTHFKAKAGSKQGCNLSLLLANIFLSDLHQALEKEHVCAPLLSKHRVTSISWGDDLLIMSLNASGLQKCTQNLKHLQNSGVW